MPVAPAIGAAGITAGSSILSGLLAPGPMSGTKRGASDFLSQLMSGQGGFGSVRPGDVNAAYGTANNALQGNYGRAMGMAGQGAGAQAGAFGATNPYAWIQHAQGQVGNQFANQFGGLASQQAMSQLQRLFQDQQTRTQLIGMGGS